MMSDLAAKLFDIPLDSWQDKVFLGLFCLGALTWLIQCYYYLFIYLRVSTFKKRHVKSDHDPVSVIICARNESENLKKNLPSILNQVYPDFQVVVVNDGSTDDSEELLAEFKTRFKNLYVTQINHTHKYPHAKKLAQTVGIKAARHDILIFTDADCYPTTPNWISQIQSNFLQKTEIVLGYGGYEERKGLVNKFIRTDTLYIAMQYLGMAIKGKPYMGIGRNLAYRKSLFFENKGFASHLHLVSGDDDLFINETASAVNTAVEIHHDSITRSFPKESFRDWFWQKRRHLTTGFYYKPSDKRRIGVEVVTRELFYLLTLFMCIMGSFTGYFLGLLLVRLILHLIIIKRTMKGLNESKILLFSILYDLVMPIISGSLIIFNRLRKRKRISW